MNSDANDGTPPTPGRKGPQIRADQRIIADLVPRSARVLDVGCGDGALLRHLVDTLGTDARGIEIDPERVTACLSQGLSVVQGDAEVDLPDYPSGAFDFVILSQTLQAFRDPRKMLEALLRIGQRAAVSITNAGYWRNRVEYTLAGRVPFRESTGDAWYDTPNIHPCTLRDFMELADAMGISIERCTAVRASGSIRDVSPKSAAANLFAVQAVFLLR
jgi:methionine biosynthesis protein MetW